MRSVNATRPERGPMTRQYKKVYGPFKKIPFRIACLNDAPVEFWLHYDAFIKKNRPCVGEADCMYCKQHQNRRYKAYVAAIRTDTNEVCVAEISEHAMGCLETLGADLTKMRGMVFTMKRVKDHVNAPVWVVDIDKVSKPSQLLPPFDVVPHLHRLWGWVEEHKEELRERIAIEEMTADEITRRPLAEGEVPY